MTDILNGATASGDDPAPKKKVGYKNPPESGKFQIGHKGYKKKQGTQNLKTILTDEIFGKVTFLEKGKKVTDSKFRVMMRQLMNQALQGNQKAIIAVITIVMKIMPPADEEGNVTTLSDAEKAVMNDWAAMMAMFKPASGEE